MSVALQLLVVLVALCMVPGGAGGGRRARLCFFSELASHFLRVLARVIFFMADVARARGAFLLQLRGIVFPSASFSCGRVAVFWSVRYFSRMALFFERVFFRGWGGRGPLRCPRLVVLFFRGLLCLLCLLCFKRFALFLFACGCVRAWLCVWMGKGDGRGSGGVSFFAVCVVNSKGRVAAFRLE